MMFEQLEGSFEALYGFLECPLRARRIVAILILIHTILLAYSAYVHSPTLNEPGHLSSGLFHWKTGRFEPYCVNPPLVRMIAAIPVLAAGYQVDRSPFADHVGTRPEFRMGRDFVANNGQRSFFLFMIARWFAIPFSWIGATVCYLWASHLYGRPAGILACTLWCFEPNILAHASLITPDAGATALGLCACYLYWRWLKSPTWSNAAIAGCVLGVAQLTKHTLIVLYLVFPVMWCIQCLSARHKVQSRNAYRETAMIAVIVLCSVYVVNVGYGFDGSFEKLANVAFVSDLFSRRHAYEDSHPEHSPYSDHWFGDIPVPLPKHYVLGIDLQRKDFEDVRWPSYMFGKWSYGGWWYFYLYCAVIKVPLAMWIMGLTAIVLRQFTLITLKTSAADQGAVIRSNSDHNCGDLSFNDKLLDETNLLLPAAVIFTFVSAQTGFTEHFRYVLPCFPFFFIAISQVACVFADGKKRKCARRLTFCRPGGYANPPSRKWRVWIQRKARFRTPIIGLLIVWFMLSSVWLYPHSLSYFNEAIGGPLHGWKYLLSSNLDWGQDLRYLDWWRSQNQALLLRIDYFGGFRPEDVGVYPKMEGTQARTPPVVQGFGKPSRKPEARYYATSLMSLFDHIHGEPQRSGLLRSDYRAGECDQASDSVVIPVTYSIATFAEGKN